MADEKNINDEYQYVEEGDIEPVSPELNESPPPADSSDYAEKFNSIIQKPNIRRNAIIAVVALFILLGVIKCTSSEPPKTNDNKAQESYQQQQARLLQEKSQAAPKAQELDTPELNQLSANQNNLQNTISGLSSQVNQLTNQVNSLNNNYQTLMQEFASLQNKLNLAVQAIEELSASQKSKRQLTPAPHHYRKVRAYTPIQYEKYYIQAIIPGRAWLISSNGQTLTVTVGSKVPGYGTVRKILPLEGRVIMSSSRILKFNQEL